MKIQYRFHYLIMLLIFIGFSYNLADGATADEIRNLRLNFTQIKNRTVWPIAGSDFTRVSSVFGPRIKGSTQDYDFHLGVDLPENEGIPALSALSGELYSIVTYENAGLTVILKHSFPTPFIYEGTEIRKFYTYYCHLSKVSDDLLNAPKGTHVKTGQTIGFVGQSGNATEPHLHYELRVGTPCSLEYQLANPSCTCSNYKFEPI